MRLALVSDLHGNEIALEAVLADARDAGYDKLVCLGDVATLGPRPSAVLARLGELGCPCILGNHDEFMLDAELIHTYSESPLIIDSVKATREALSENEIAFIRTFVRTLTLEDGDVLLYHGTPRSNMEDLIATTPTERVDEMLGTSENADANANANPNANGNAKSALVLAGGHTHLQMLRQHRGMLIVNSGSVGIPIRDYAAGGPPVIMHHAEYAIVDVRKARSVSVDLRRVPLDRHALASQIDGWDNALAPSLRANYA